MKLYIETVGCQMNELDSELVVASLRKDGYELTRDVRDADTILFNTCSVRQHAEDKIYSALGRLKNAKQRASRTKSSASSAAWPRRTKASFSSGRRTSTWSSAPASCTRCPRIVREIRARRRAADGSQPGPQGRQPRRRSSAATKASIRSAIRRCGRRRSRRTCGS